jgi:anaerobic sulfite reductase subunit A
MIDDRGAMTDRLRPTARQARWRDFVESTPENAALLENRENLYRLLARLYRAEVDPVFLDGLAAMSFPVAENDDDMAVGARLLEGWLRQPQSDPLTTLAVDYARIFLGAGIASGAVAYPYESVYTSPERLVMQDARDKVVAAYRTSGLDKSDALSVPEDHIALEMEFMAHLCAETRHALAAAESERVASALTRQSEFLARHLANWVPAFCADVAVCADTDFYKGVAKLTAGYLRMDEAILADLAAELAD